MFVTSAAQFLEHSIAPRILRESCSFLLTKTERVVLALRAEKRCGKTAH